MRYLFFKIRRILILIPFLWIRLDAQIPGQPLDAMQNPPSVKWKSIKTPHFNIIFPLEIVPAAQRVANTLELVYPADWKTLGRPPKPISLILQNRSTTSNGFVTLAPRHSEWFNTPPQTGLIGSVPWYNLLSIHEFRHVVQFDRFNYGFNRFLYWLMGDFGLLAGIGYSIPIWFMEGDAVVMETTLSHSGRGRMPEFDMPIRTMLLSDKCFSYYKMTLGSYRNWYANLYSYGYLINAYVRRHKGQSAWPKIVHNTNKFSFLPYRFSYSMRRVTGKGVFRTHRATMAELKALWHEQGNGVQVSESRKINQSNRGFLTNYLYPQITTDGSVLVFKSGFADQGAFVRIQPDGQEQVLFHPNETDGAPHSVKGDMLVWAEKHPDVRWGYQDYCEIHSYNIKTRKKKTITHKSRLFAPALSPDGRTIAAVAFNCDNSCNLVLLDAETGRKIREISNSENAFLMTPRWSEDGKKLIFNRLSDKGRALAVLRLDKDEMEDIIPYCNMNTSLPIFFENYAMYNCDFGGVNNIFAIDIETKKVYQVTSRPFGAFNPAISPDKKKIYFNDYDLAGYNLAEMVCDPAQWTAVEQKQDRSVKYYEPLLKQEAGMDLLEEIPQKKWEVQDYAAWKHLFNPHSWTLESDPRAEVYGLSLYASNLLGTLQSTAGFQYNSNEKNGHFKAGVSYGGWYPLIDITGLYGARASTYFDKQDSTRRYTWQEKTIDFGIRLPFDLSRNGYQMAVNLGAGLSQTKISSISDQAGFDNFSNREGWFTPVKYNFQFIRYRKAYADILPVRGQTLQIGYRHTPLGGDYHGRLLVAEAVAYIPGLLKRHGLRIGLAYEGQKQQQYRFESEMLFPRGYDYVFHEKMTKLSLDYALPLLYPDQHIWALLYFRRIKADLFYDHGVSSDDNRQQFYRSAGAELTADFNFLSLIAPLEAGVRFSYCVEKKTWRAKAIVGLGM